MRQIVQSQYSRNKKRAIEMSQNPCRFHFGEQDILKKCTDNRLHISNVLIFYIKFGISLALFTDKPPIVEEIFTVINTLSSDGVNSQFQPVIRNLIN